MRQIDPSNVRARLKKPAWKRNFKRKLPRPAQSNGRLQRACRRALWAHDVVSTSVAMDWCYWRLQWEERRPNHLNLAVRYAMKTIGAVRIGRARTRGRPWLWRAPKGNALARRIGSANGSKTTPAKHRRLQLGV
jgi:hypothetical protein